MESQLFSPFRSVGYVSNHVPFDVILRGSEHFVTTAVGNSFHQYNVSKLNLNFVGEPLPDAITTILSTKKRILTAAGKKVFVYERGKIVNEYNKHDEEIILMIGFGEIVLSIDNKSFVNIWSEQTLETFSSIAFNEASFRVTSLVHPSTYLNKVLFGSEQGTLQIWNIRTNKMVYEIVGWKSPVITLKQAPAIDVIGIGLQNGDIHLHNISVDQTIMSFHQDHGPVISMSFRTDGSPIMASGSPAGHIVYWNLEKREILWTQFYAHNGSVTSIDFLQKQPLVLSSGPDNSLKVWIFDNPDGSGRLLRSRCGHSGPPRQILFYGTYGNVLLSSGMDNSLRHTSIMRSVQCHEFSQGSIASTANKKKVEEKTLKLPPITCFAAETSRQYDWDNIVTCHLGLNEAITWSTSKRSIGKHRFSYSGGKSTPTAVDISSCGNFCVVGYANGHLDKFNLQSGLKRGSFKQQSNKDDHKGVIRGVSIDASNFQLVSTSSDRSIKFWNFKEQTLVDTVKCHCPISKSKLHRESSLLVVCFDDFSVELYDIDTKRVVRQFHGHSNTITDTSWSFDGRWLVTSSMDCTIKTWDVPSARLIDCFCVNEAATSVAFSPSGEFLASTHQDNLGIYLWANKVTYSGIFPKPLPNDYQPSTISLPTTQIEVNDEHCERGLESVETSGNEDDSISSYESPEQLAEKIITLSTLPESKWKALTCMDLIKSRNKPIEPPKKPKAAPFFLPTVAGIETKFVVDASNQEQQQEVTDQSKFIRTGKFDFSSDFHRMLYDIDDDQKVSSIHEKLLGFAPSEADVELRTLSPDAGGDIDLMVNFMKLLRVLILTGKDFELLQAYLSLFIKLHGDAIRSDDKLLIETENLLETITNSWSHTHELIQESSCLVNYFRSATI